MIWLSWRQQRFESALTALVLGAAAALLLVTHQRLLVTFSNLGIPSCLESHSTATACTNAYDAFKQNVVSEQTTINWLAYVPILLGVLLAATLAIEFEEGSYRLSWTQGITRGRWALWRIGFALATGLIAAAALASLSTWWLEPLNRLQSPLLPGSFEIAGIVPIAYALLGFATTLVVAVIWRRTLPALAIGVTVSVFLHLLLQNFRATLLTPVTRIWITGPAPYSRRDWLLQGGAGAGNYQYLGAHGQSLSAEQMQQLCGRVIDGASKEHFSGCLLTHHIGELIRFQPPSRFWNMQLIEAGITTSLAFALLLAAILWLRTRSY